MRLLRQTPDWGEHGIEKPADVNASRIKFLVFLRPHHLTKIRLSILDRDRRPLAQVDFELNERSSLGKTSSRDGVELINAEFQFRNGYFNCEMAVDLRTEIASVFFAVNALDDAGNAIYQGDNDRGFFVNLFSVREVL